MRRLTHVLAFSAALLAAGCSGKSDCQLMQERLCSCTGATSDACATQAENLVNGLDLEQKSPCGPLLSSCNPPSDATLCEWIHTPDGKIACGLAIDPTSPTTTTP
ncbi:MAG TPA: hypothetical protein VF875_05550 [Anaeromyxobacter sp.]